jgi:hypothetical protein
MLNSFAMMHAGARRPAIPPNSSQTTLFLEQRCLERCNFWHLPCAPEPVEAKSVSYRGTGPEAKMRALIRHFPTTP